MAWRIRRSWMLRLTGRSWELYGFYVCRHRMISRGLSLSLLRFMVREKFKGFPNSIRSRLRVDAISSSKGAASLALSRMSMLCHSIPRYRYLPAILSPRIPFHFPLNEKESQLSLYPHYTSNIETYLSARKPRYRTYRSRS